jgi:hypothetical protein
LQTYFDIYQHLGTAWEFSGLQCGHWEGYKKTRNGKEACRICGKVRDVDETYYLLTRKGIKKIGTKLKPNSKKTFKDKKEATIVDDTIDFYGAVVNVDVHNAFKSLLFAREHEINMAAERIVTLKENGIECHIDQHLIHIRMNKARKKKKKRGKSYTVVSHGK